MSNAQTFAFVVNSDNKSCSLKPIGIPGPGPNEVIIRVHAAAQNPADLKALDYGFATEGVVPGCDFSGVVEIVGKTVQRVKAGDRVAGFTRGGRRVGHGAFAQRICVDGDNLLRIPDGISFDEAASYPIAFQTATMGLYLSMKLPLPYSTPNPAMEKTPILVWGGATSVGTMVIQLAKLSGLTVITTASSKNESYLKSLGADYVFPHDDPETPAAIRKLTNGKLYLGYNNISHGTTQLVLDAFGSDSDIPAGKKELVHLSVWPEQLDEKATHVKQHAILTYTMLCQEMTVGDLHFPASPTDYAFSIRSYEMLERLLEERKITHQRLKIFGGLETVPEGFVYMRAGRNSAEKIVYHPLATRL